MAGGAHVLRALAIGALALGCGGSGGGSDADSDADSDSDTDTDTDTDSGGPVDFDGDGFFDPEEDACGSDASDPASTCYRCGWRRGDPGDLGSDPPVRADEGDTIENVPLVDQCGDEVPLWDFAGQYHILFMTTAW